MEYLIIIFQYSKRLYVWSGKPWPFHVFPAFILIHFVFLHFIPTVNHSGFNGYFSAFFQIIGGIIVLHSINSNMRLLSKSNMLKELYSWIKSFPLKPKVIEIKSGISAIAITSSATITVLPKFSTTEEKVEFLLNENKRIESKIDETERTILKELQLNVNKNDKKQSEIRGEIVEIEKKLKTTMVGSVKLEVLGILFISYGIFIPLIY